MPHLGSSYLKAFAAPGLCLQCPSHPVSPSLSTHFIHPSLQGKPHLILCQSASRKAPQGGQDTRQEALRIPASQPGLVGTRSDGVCPSASLSAGRQRALRQGSLMAPGLYGPGPAAWVTLDNSSLYKPQFPHASSRGDGLDGGGARNLLRFPVAWHVSHV